MSRFYVTTPIYYVNDAPHIGHAYPTVIADALARWHRLRGDDVLFLTGTDEHGLKVQRAAEAAGRTPREHADANAARYREAWDLLDVRPDDFIRTSEPRHHAAVQKMLQVAHDNGHIYPATYAGWYCVACEAYYAPDDLLPAGNGTVGTTENGTVGTTGGGAGGGRCPIHERPVEWFEEENWFFRLSAFAQPLLDWYAAHPDAVQPEGKRNEALGIIAQGLQDISISRSSISWGIPVPWDPSQVFYVWYDALINYATAAGYGEDHARFAEWWPTVHHVLGKDILRFHCVYWPAMLMAVGEAPPHRLLVHGYLLVGGAKMSKTSLNQIAPADLVTDFGVDGFRHHLLHDLPFGPDGDFTHEGMVARYNQDLANNLGNLLARVTTVVHKKCGGIAPAPAPDSPLAASAADAVERTVAAWDAAHPSRALDATWSLLRDTNAYLEAHEPWRAEPGPAVDAVLGDALEVLRIVSVLATPALTRAPQEIWRRIGLPGSPTEVRVPEGLVWGGFPGGCAVDTGAPLFPRLRT